MLSKLGIAVAVFIIALPVFAQSTPPGNGGVTRATLDNGLRVVIIRDPLAPVVTVEENYLVGGDETPAGYPGMAHAQEHMAFRGCSSLTADQIAAILAQLGGAGNADTQQNITQFFETVPAADLEIDALERLDLRFAGAVDLPHIHSAHDDFGTRHGTTGLTTFREL